MIGKQEYMNMSLPAIIEMATARPAPKMLNFDMAAVEINSDENALYMVGHLKEKNLLKPFR